MKIYVHSDESDQFQFGSLADALNWAEKLIDDSDDKEITITIYVNDQA